MKTAAITLAPLALLSTVLGAPVKRQAAMGPSDFDILQYALTLEHLEATFYAQGLANFTDSDFSNAGLDSSIRKRIVEIGGHEKSHVEFLSTVLTSLNQTPTAACSYAFGVTDPKSFLATASILEGVGVSAYLGAAASIADKTYLTPAAAILTVESRHSAYIRGAIGQDPIPAPYDTPLTFNEVYSLASGFITGCPESNPMLPVKAFPALTVMPYQDSLKPLSWIKVEADPSVYSGKNPIYAAWIGLTDTQFGLFDPAKELVQIPENFAGQTYVVLTTSNTSVTDDNTIAGPGVVNLPGY